MKEGDHIQVGQVICEIETDKATIEYESPDAGRLARIVAREQDTIPIKQPIAFLADNDADVVNSSWGGLGAPSSYEQDVIRYAYQNGADFLCVGMFDFQVINNANLVTDALKSDLKRERSWYA